LEQGSAFFEVRTPAVPEISLTFYATGPWQVLKALGLEDDLVAFTESPQRDAQGEFSLNLSSGLYLTATPSTRVSLSEERSS
jgi:hypothetical protein